MSVYKCHTLEENWENNIHYTGAIHWRKVGGITSHFSGAIHLRKAGGIHK
jgi:hypothetical protein